jgi:hypothetical protein
VCQSQVIPAVLLRDWASETTAPWDEHLTCWHTQDQDHSLGSINHVHLHLQQGFFRSVHLVLPFSCTYSTSLPPWLAACLSCEAGMTGPHPLAGIPGIELF